MYAVGQKDGLIKLTDDGWTLDNSLSRGVDINKSKKRKTILINQLRGYGISFACKKLVLHVQHIWKKHDYLMKNARKSPYFNVGMDRACRL